MEPKRRYRHVQQLRWAILAGRIRRRILYPVLALLLILTSGAMLWSYVTDTDFRDAIGIVCSSNRDLIFSTVNMEELKNSDAELRRFPGDALEIYEKLVRICPEGNFISTGYSGDDGYLLFGGFSATYNITTGERNYSAFEGLYYLTAEQTVVRIPPEDCEPYAPAVLALYQLDVFDTPLF
nr:hypothetical protein [uncultured Oscillibacter sp.]